MAANDSDGGETTWARWLRARLRERGWTQAGLVRHSRGAVSRPQVSRWLAGAAPDLDGISATCSALRVPVLDFLQAAGYVDLSTVGVVVERVDITGLSKGELLDEIARRIPDTVSGGTVTHLSTPRGSDGEAEGLWDDDVILGPADSDAARENTQ